MEGGTSLKTNCEDSIEDGRGVFEVETIRSTYPCKLIV